MTHELNAMKILIEVQKSFIEDSKRVYNQLKVLSEKLEADLSEIENTSTK